MVHWHILLQTFRPFSSLPRAVALASETIFDPSYRHEGKFRQKDETCLFKYTLAGEGIFRDAAGEHRVSAGTGFLCEIRDPATAYYYPPDGKAPWTFVYMNIAGAAAFKAVREMVRRYGPIYELPRESGIVAEMLSFAEVREKQLTISPAAGARLAAALLTDLAESREHARRQDAGSRLAGRAVAIIRKNLHTDMNVADLAARLGVSREHLTRVFREQTSQPPRQFILRQKMLRACHLLKTTSLTHKEIAARLGYDAPSHFSRTFRHMLGISPGRFRAVGTIPME